MSSHSSFSSAHLDSVARRALCAGAILLLCAPLVVIPFILFPFVAGKVVYITTVITLLMPLVVIRLAHIRSSFLRGSYIPFFLALYIGIGTVAALFGIDVRQSFFGTDERGSGVLVGVIMGVMYLGLTAAVYKRSVWNAFLWVAVGVGIVVAMFGIRENVVSGGTRVGALFGNPILFGNYVLFPCFFALHLACISKRRWIRILAVAAAIFLAYGVWIAQTRGVLIGLFAGVITAAVLVFFLSRRHLRAWAAGCMLIIVVAAGALFMVRDTDVVRKNQTLARLTQISIADASTEERVLLWQVALRAFKERPILGWGPENFDYAFDRFYNPRFLRFSISETWTDRAHNMFFDSLVMTGIVGFLVFVGLLASCLHAVARARKSGAVSSTGAATLHGLIVAYAVQGLFAFDGPATTLMFFFTLAYAHTIAGVNLSRPNVLTVPRRFGARYAVLTVALFLTVFVCIYLVRLTRASNALLNAVTRHPAEGGNILREAQIALAHRVPYRYSMQLRFANRVFEDALQYSGEHARALIPFAIEETKKMRTAHPHDFASAFILGNLYTQAGRVLDPAYFADAVSAYEEAIPSSPARQAVYFQLGSVAVLEGDLVRAEEFFRRARDLDHAVGEGWWRWALVVAKQGNAEAAIEGMRRAFQERYTPKSLKEVTFVAQFSIEHNAPEMGETLMARAVIIAPERVSEWSDPGAATKFFAQAIRREPTRDDLWQALDELYRVFRRETALVRALIGAYSNFDDPVVQSHIRQLTEYLNRT